MTLCDLEGEEDESGAFGAGGYCRAITLFPFPLSFFEYEFRIESAEDDEEVEGVTEEEEALEE